MSPGQLMDEVLNQFRGGDGSQMLANLQSQARDNPMALALVGSGLAWLMMGSGSARARRRRRRARGRRPIGRRPRPSAPTRRRAPRASAPPPATRRAAAMPPGGPAGPDTLRPALPRGADIPRADKPRASMARAGMARSRRERPTPSPRPGKPSGRGCITPATGASGWPMRCAPPATTPSGTSATPRPT